MKNFGFEKLLAVLAVAFACVGMWGCTEVTFEWYDERSKPSIAGFINDSFVVVTDCRGWYEDTETKWNSGYSTVTSCGHDRMMVYNYRVQEDGPRWSDSLTNKYDGRHWYQMTDSVFWRWNGDDLYLWKVGEKAHEMRLAWKNDGCSESFKIDRIRQWLNGKFIALGGKFDADGENCQYAVLDTVEKTLAFKRLDEKLEWIKKCDDVRAWGQNAYCLFFNKEERSSSLFRNDTLIHKLENDFSWTAGAKLSFQGYMLLLERDVCQIVGTGIECFASASSEGAFFKNKLENTYIDY